MLPNGPDWPSCLGGSLKSHRGISIFLIFLWSSHQVGMKKIFKTFPDFFCYFKASDSHCDWHVDIFKTAFVNFLPLSNSLRSSTVQWTGSLDLAKAMHFLCLGADRLCVGGPISIWYQQSLLGHGREINMKNWWRIGEYINTEKWNSFWATG